MRNGNNLLRFSEIGFKWIVAQADRVLVYLCRIIPANVIYERIPNYILRKKRKIEIIHKKIEQGEIIIK